MNTPDMMRVGEFAVDVPATATAAQRRWLKRWLDNAVADESDAAGMDVVAEEIGVDGEIRLSWLAGDRHRQQLIISREADGSYAEGPAPSDDRLEAGRRLIAASLTEEMGVYRPRDPVEAAAAYVAGLHFHNVDDPARTSQLAATNALGRLIRRGHELGLPPLVWQLGGKCNLSGYLAGAALPCPYTEDDLVRAYLAWCALVGATAIRHDGPSGHADRWNTDPVELTPGVSVSLRYARDWFAEPCSVCCATLPDNDKENA